MKFQLFKFSIALLIIMQACNGQKQTVTTEDSMSKEVKEMKEEKRFEADQRVTTIEVLLGDGLGSNLILSKFEEYNCTTKGQVSKSQNLYHFDFDNSLVSDEEMLKQIQATKGVISARIVSVDREGVTSGMSGKKGKVKIGG